MTNFNFPALSPPHGDFNTPYRQFRFALHAVAIMRGADTWLHEPGSEPFMIRDRDGNGALRLFLDRSAAMKAKSRGPKAFNLPALKNELSGALIAIISGEPDYEAGQGFGHAMAAQETINAAFIVTTPRHHLEWSHALETIGGKILLEVATLGPNGGRA